MLPQARCCARKQLTRCLFPFDQRTAQPEPLLFLYPLWFRNASRRSQRAYIHASAATRNELTAEQENEQSVSGDTSSRCNESLEEESPADTLPDITVRRLIQKKPPKTRPIKEDAPGGLSGLSPILTERRKVFDKNDSQSASTDTELASRGTSDSLHGLILARKLAKIVSAPIPPRDQLRVTTTFLEWFAGTSEPNMWLHEGAKCQVLDLALGQDDLEHRTIVFEGRKQSRDEALTVFTNMFQKFDSSEDDLQMESDLDQINAAFSVRQANSTHMVPMPDIWTVKTFYDYVQRIVNHSPPAVAEKALGLGREEPGQKATKAILDVFSSPEFTPYLSVAALRIVLEKFRGRTDMISNISRTWTAVCDAGLVPDIKCFNLELERALAVSNSQRVNYLLRGMQMLHIKPDVISWTLIFERLDNSNLRRNIVNALLKSKSLRGPQDRDTVVLALIRTEFRAVVTEEDGIPQFAQWSVRRFGEEWLSPEAVSEMVAQCVYSKVAWKVHEILDLARYYGIGLDKVDSCVLLDVLRRTSNFEDTLAFFKTFFSQDDFEIAQTQIEVLFKAAWYQSLFNTCRVIWQFSASRGMITYAMQELVVRSLAMNNVDGKKRSPHAPKLRSWLAAVTIGTNLKIKEPQKTFPLLSEKGWSERIPEMLCQWLPNDGTRHEQLQLGHMLLQRDLNASGVYRPMRHESLLKQLQAAYGRDRRWYIEGFFDTASFSDILDQTLKVGLHRKRRSEWHRLRRLAADAKKQDPNLSPDVALIPASTVQPKDHSIVKSNTSNQQTELIKAVKTEIFPVRHASSHDSAIALAAPVLLYSSNSLLDVMLEYLRYGWEVSQNR